MSTPVDYRALVRMATGHDAIAPLITALGFEPGGDPVPRSAWPAWGLADAEGLDALAVVGRAGSMDALLLETTDEGPHLPRALASRVRRRNPARLHLYVVASPRYARLCFGTFGLDETFRQVIIDRSDIRPSDLETLDELASRNGEAGLELALRHARALDGARLTRRFFRDFSARRDALAVAWTGLPADEGRDRRRLALLFLSRLTFLYFLQRRGALAGDDRYLPRLFGRWCGGGAAGAGGNGGGGSGGGGSGGEERRGERSFYRARLAPLFFGALNRPVADRTPEAAALGALPYLNGGLFERHALERTYPDLDLPDATVAACFDHLLERYRFSVRESADGAGHGIDPEVLGRVFEELMAPERRESTGSFYTPAPVVRRVVREAVAAYIEPACTSGEARSVVDGDAEAIRPETRYRIRTSLERVRVLDPACGSGAFLLGALHRLAVSLDGLSERPAGEVRRGIVARSLHGVDLLDDAALLASLRLWLALSVNDDRIRPLPNLDRRIRQGDALVDPLDLGAVEVGDGGGSWRPLRDPAIRRLLRAVEPAGRGYLESGPEDRDRLRRRLGLVEHRLARRWLDGARIAQSSRLRALRARSEDRDLFGDTPPEARRAADAAARGEERLRELDEARRALDEEGALPFFSFGVHFADASPGFDLIVSNPPWVRAHRWPDRIRRLAKRYEVCRSPAWSRAAALTGAPAAAGAQVDLSLLFLERSIRLLAPGGVLAVLLPTKALRALYGGAARRILMRDMEFTSIEDHGLDQRSIFRADAFAAVLVARKRRAGGHCSGPGVGPGGEEGGPGETESPRIRVRLVRRGRDPLELRVRQRDLPLFPDDPESPWLLAPPEVVALFRRMQAAGPPLGDHEGLRVRRGVMTAANDVLLFTGVRSRLGGLAEVEAEGHRRARRRGEGRSARSRFRALVEESALRPIVRGSDIDAFRYSADDRVAWCHDGRGRPVEPPPRMARYLERHRTRLEARQGWRPGLPLGSVFRIGEGTLGPRVAWQDLSDTLRAVALPAAVKVHGHERELVPLNTVYFIPTPSHQTAVLLAGLLNALPVTLFARALAERAKDARFRFFAWTVSSLPLPLGWRDVTATRVIAEISADAHRRGGIDPGARRRLDAAVALLYGLDTRELGALRDFDRWLRGEG